MRRWLGGLVAVVLLGVLVAAWWWSSDDAPPETPGAPLSSWAAANEGASPERRPSRWDAPVTARGDRSVQGVVLRAGQPVAGAVVTALLAHGEEVLSDLPCQCDNHCGQKLLACGCAEASGQLVELVSVRTGEGVPLGRATTDAEGRFTLAGLEAGTLTLWADGPAGIAWKSDVASDATGVQLELSDGRVLKGTVKKTDGSPAAGALVTAIFSEQSRFFDVVAGADGSFRIGPVPLGKYAVVAMSGGLLPDHQQVRADDEEPITLELSVPRTLSGTVRRNDEPVAGVTVKLSGLHRKRSVTSDEEGAFRVERLRPGEYELDALLPSELAHVTAKVPKERDLDDVVLELARGRVVKGLVVDERGSPLQDVKVSVDEGNDWRKAQTDAQGRFALDAVSDSGEHWISASKQGYLEQRLRLPPGEEVTVTLKQASLLTGRVITRDGTVVPKFRVTVRADTSVTPRDSIDDDDMPSSNETGSLDSTDGGFSFELAPKAYTLTVRGPPWAPANATSRAPGDVTITVEAGATVSGRVLDVDGVPTAGARITAFSPSPRDTVSERSDADGRFKLEGLHAGTYEVRATAMLETLPTWSATAEVKTRAGETVELELRAKEGARLGGVVIDPRGEPMAGVSVTAWAKPTDGKQSTPGTGSGVTDEKGRFLLRTLPAGPVNVFARTKEGERASMPATAPDTNLIIRMKDPTLLVGRVVDEKGQPVKSFTLLDRPVQADDGRFSLPVPANQKVDFGIDADGFAQKIMSVQTKEGRNELGDITLSRGRVITGVVTDKSTGLPVAGALVDVGIAAPSGSAELAESLGAKRTDSKGRYSLTVDPTSSWIIATHEAYLMMSQPLSGATADLALEAGSSVTVRVIDANGKPIRSARVMLSSSDRFKLARPGTNDDFVAQGLAPGTWVVSTEVRGKQFFPREVTVAAGAQAVEMREPSGGVKLKVTMPESQHLMIGSGVIAAPASMSSMESLGVSLVSIRGGVVEHLAPGKWTIIGFRGQPGSFQVSANVIELTEQPEQDVVLTPKWSPLAR
jgi:protocatechuate 3,4-dioxygenase beta subunit